MVAGQHLYVMSVQYHVDLVVTLAIGLALILQHKMEEFLVKLRVQKRNLAWLTNVQVCSVVSMHHLSSFLCFELASHFARESHHFCKSVS